MKKYVSGRAENGEPIFENYIVTNFAPLGARKVFPCFDEPNYTSKYQFDIVRRKDQKTFFNSDFVQKAVFAKSGNSGNFGVSVVTESHETDRFTVTKPLPTFLLGFTIGKFETISENFDDFHIKISTIADPNGELKSKALEVAKNLLLKINALFGETDLKSIRIMGLPNYRRSQKVVQPYALSFLPFEELFSRDENFQKIVISEAILTQFLSPTELLWWDHLWQERGLIWLLANEIQDAPGRHLHFIKERHHSLSTENTIDLRDLLPMSEKEVRNTLTLSGASKWGFLTKTVKDWIEWTDQGIFRRLLRTPEFNNTLFEDPKEQDLNRTSLFLGWAYSNLK